MKSLNIFLKSYEHWCCNCIPASNITCIEKYRDTLNNCWGKVPSNCRQVDLRHGVSIFSKSLETLQVEHTFINAFESSPVHWVKSRPSGNRRRPGNGGTADILYLVLSFHTQWIERHMDRWSISVIICRALLSPCVICKYSLTHATRWSLKTPFISWWRRSGASSSWMSARGK